VTHTTSPRTVHVSAVAAQQSRDRRAQRRLEAAYAEHAAGLGRLAFLLTGDERVAEDLVQEAFVRAVARFAHLRREEALGAYLRRTVVNLAGKHHQRSWRARAFGAEAHPDRIGVAAQPDVELQDLLWSALRRLPHRQRAALVLRFYEDLSERDAARVLGCRVGTVKSLVHRALAAMREEIGGDA
jgi:RNA polymerase sigma-70 factor (sigma-E family)